MKTLLGTLAILAVVTVAGADPNNLAGGAFITHYASAIQTTEDPCGDLFLDPLTNCDDQVNTVYPVGSQEVTWFAVAAFDAEKEWCGARDPLERMARRELSN